MNCPNACTGGCDEHNTCLIDCPQVGVCDNKTLKCPNNYACRVVCSGFQSCNKTDVECPPTYACEMVCETGDCFEAQLKCDNGPCEVSCGSGGQCDSMKVDCKDNACFATCDGGDQPDVQCNNACNCSGC